MAASRQRAMAATLTPEGREREFWRVVLRALLAVADAVRVYKLGE